MTKRAVVIGGGGGIGNAIAKKLLKDGFLVSASYYSKAPEHFEGDNFQLDAKDKDAVKDNFGKILEKGPIDVIVYSVTAPIKNAQMLKLEWTDYADHLDVQVKGLFHIQEALKAQLKTKHKTKFIIILSEYCLGRPPASVAHYVTAKYALMGMAKAMAVELPRYNSSLNMVSPGMTETSLLDNLPAKLVEISAETNPMKRLGKPEDVAETVAFLAGSGSDYLNGANIVVNGGEKMA